MIRRVVPDASVILKAFASSEERHLDHALALMELWDAGEIEFVAPELLRLEVLNVAGRKWRLPEAGLTVLARALDELEIETVAVDTNRVASWVAQGLTAYDAAYVCVAESRSLTLLTDDDTIASIAPEIAQHLSTVPLA